MAAENVNFCDSSDDDSHQHPSRRRPRIDDDDNDNDNDNDNKSALRRSHRLSPSGRLLTATPFVRRRLGSVQLRHGALRILEYIPEYNCFLPRAPAFRLFSYDEVNEMVNRLYEENSAAKKMGRDVCGENGTRQEMPTISRSLGRKAVSREEMHMITERLRTPTAMSMTREQRPMFLSIMEEAPRFELKPVTAPRPRTAVYPAVAPLRRCRSAAPSLAVNKMPNRLYGRNSAVKKTGRDVCSENGTRQETPTIFRSLGRKAVSREEVNKMPNRLYGRNSAAKKAGGDVCCENGTRQETPTISRFSGQKAVSREEVNEIINRLYGGNSAAKKTGGDVCGEDGTRQETPTNSRFSGRRAVSREEMHMITERLRTPTAMSMTREQRPMFLSIMEEA